MKPYKGYSARVEFDDEDEIFVGRIAGINDVVGFHADTVEDLKAAFHEAVDDYLATCARAAARRLRG
jgi:predicted HicB family RNase H-like nuclease